MRFLGLKAPGLRQKMPEFTQIFAFFASRIPFFANFSQEMPLIYLAKC